MSSQPSSETSIECFGHVVPPFRTVFPKVFRAGIDAMDVEQIEAVAGTLSEADRAVLGNYLGPDGIERLLEGLPADKADRLRASYGAAGERDDEAFRRIYPVLAATTNNILSLEQLAQVLGKLGAEDMASQCFYFGAEGLRVAFSSIKRDRAEAVLDHTAEWVLIETGRRALSALKQYTCTLNKQERIGGKLQGVETIAIKARHKPRASYLKWVAGPYKGREALYNEQLLGVGRVRVREAGLLGVMPVTLDVDSAVARRGTKHLITEVGLLPLVELIEREYRKAAPSGDIDRKNCGIAELDGRPTYCMECVLPRDRSRGYYCHRMVQYTDYVQAFAVKAEVYNFDDELDESFHYRDIDPAARLADEDFDPKNRSYKL